jgi:hypothetical protein
MPSKTNRYANKERNHVRRGRELERKGLERSGHHGIFVILLKGTLMNTEKQWTCHFPAIK